MCSVRLSNKVAPRVSIGMPVYNGERFIAQAIESILGQSFAEFELIISDNASEDGTQDICEEYARLDSRIRYVRQVKNLGAAPNYNYVFERSSAPLFKWAAHDDIIRPAFLEKCVSAHDASEEAPVLVYPASELIDETNAVIRPVSDELQARSNFPAIRAFEVLQRLNIVTAIGGVFDRAALSRTRLIGSFIASDYVLLLEAAMLGKIIYLEGQPLFCRRIHENASRKANVTEKEVLRWFDPKERSNLTGRQRLYLEYLRSVCRIDGLSAPGRLATGCSVITGITVKRARVRAGKWKRGLKEKFGA